MRWRFENEDYCERRQSVLISSLLCSLRRHELDNKTSYKNLDDIQERLGNICEI